MQCCSPAAKRDLDIERFLLQYKQEISNLSKNIQSITIGIVCDRSIPNHVYIILFLLYALQYLYYLALILSIFWNIQFWECMELIHNFTGFYWERNVTYTTHIPVMVRAGRLTGSIIQRDIFQHLEQTLSSFSSSASRAIPAQVVLTFTFVCLTSALIHSGRWGLVDGAPARQMCPLKWRMMGEEKQHHHHHGHHDLSPDYTSNLSNYFQL